MHNKNRTSSIHFTSTRIKNKKNINELNPF